MHLRQYLSSIESVLHSRRDVTIELLTIREVESTQTATLRVRVRFQDESLLEFAEALAVQGMIVVKKQYSYHYQDESNQLIFRYDNAPHHPDIATHPHHKHVAGPTGENERIMGTTPPDLVAVLHEIESMAYGGE